MRSGDAYLLGALGRAIWQLKETHNPSLLPAPCPSGNLPRRRPRRSGIPAPAPGVAAGPRSRSCTAVPAGLYFGADQGPFQHFCCWWLPRAIRCWKPAWLVLHAIQLLARLTALALSLRHCAPFRRLPRPHSPPSSSQCTAWAMRRRRRQQYGKTQREGEPGLWSWACWPSMHPYCCHVRSVLRVGCSCSAG